MSSISRVSVIVRFEIDGPWKSPRGGVNRAKLKFTNINTTTSRVSVRNRKRVRERGRKTNPKRISKWDTEICFTEVRFLQTYSPLRRPQRPGLFQPFPLSHDPRIEWAFSSQSLGTQSSHKDHHKFGVSCLNYKWVWLRWKNQEGRKQSKRKSSKEHKQITLSSHYGVVWNLERIWSLWCV
jgi:hypothetical protein